MSAKIDFWIPVRYENQPTSLGQRIGQWADSYFSRGGSVAIVIPGVVENGSAGVKLQEEQAAYWQTALKIASRFTIIIPIPLFIVKVISRSFYPFHMCQRTFPDGTQETGAFVNGVLWQGVRTQGKHVSFLRPKLLLRGVELQQEGIELNFAEVTINGQTEVIPVQAPYQERVLDGNKLHTRYPGSPKEALLKIAQDHTKCNAWGGNCHYGSPVKYLLEHADNHLLQAQELLMYLLTPNEQGILPLHTINKSSLLEILELAKDNQIAIDLQTADSATRETLFSKWAGIGDVELTQALLSMDPSAIRQTENREESFFMKAILGGHEEEAQILWQAMKEQQVALSIADQWIQKMFKNDCNFTREAFLELPTELQCKLFQIANIYMHTEFLLKLRGFGMYQLPTKPEKAALFSYNMDAIEVEKVLRHFLENLRREGLLLTKEEFAQKDSAQYYHKYTSIGRILGRDYIERAAEQLHLPYIRVPKKMAVIQTKDEQDRFLKFTVSRDGRMDVKCRELQIYAERIEAIDRKATKQEMIGLLDVIEATGFDDFFGCNLLMGKNQTGKEGIYFIDTEYANFSSLPSYDHIESLGELMSVEDLPWLQEQLNRRLDLLRKQRAATEEALQQKWNLQKPIFTEYGFASRCKPFRIAIENLTAHDHEEA